MTGRETGPRLVGIGAVFIDDIVLPSGQTYMGQLGGGVVHALMGAAIWDERPGLVAVTGDGLPPPAQARLEQHFDTAGMWPLALPQMRAWQIFEEDGTRRELYRVQETEPFIRGAQPEHLPPQYRNSQGFYLLQDFEGIQAWRAALPGTVLWEPLQQVMRPGNRERLRAVLSGCQIDIISPNLDETQAVYGPLPPDDLINALFDDGAKIVALRMGAKGSLVANQKTGERHYLNTLSLTRIVDQTGAGNTYCGAFLTGLLQGRSLTAAAAMGTVSASFCLEHVGVAKVEMVHREERDRRYTQIMTTPNPF